MFLWQIFCQLLAYSASPAQPNWESLLKARRQKLKDILNQLLLRWAFSGFLKGSLYVSVTLLSNPLVCLVTETLYAILNMTEICLAMLVQRTVL